MKHTSISNHAVPKPATRVGRWIWLLACLALAVAAALPARVSACIVTNTPPTVHICPLPNCKARIIIAGYSTFGAAPGSMFCECAFKKVPSIVSIDKSSVVTCRNCSEGGPIAQGTNCCGGQNLTPIPGFNNGGQSGFNLSAITANFFQGAQGGNWGGFFSSVYAGIPPNTCVDLVFEVTLVSPCSANQLRNELAVGGLVASSAADNTGLPIDPGGHLSYVAFPLSSITIDPSFHDDIYFSTPECPAPGSSYASSPIIPPVRFGTLALARDFVHSDLPSPIQPPPPGQTAIYQAPITKIDARFSVDGGATFVSGWAPASMAARITHISDSGGTAYFQTEMLQLNIGGGNLPAGVMLRESPTRASLGQHTITPASAGSGVLVSSFFDVFLELSADGGATWVPASDAVRVVLRTSNPIPTVSEWGLIILALLMLSIGTAFIMRQRPAASSAA